MTDVLRVGNCSGFYGDRLSAMREMLEGGDLDVLTGDYLAELTMLILGRDQMKDPSLGYARTFARQVEDCLGLALERGVRIVSNAGGLNPAGLAARLQEVATQLGLDAKVAYVDGDDLRGRAADLGFPDALTANAYLGGFGIAEALTAGADIVVTGRVTDASLVVGPAIAHFGWTPTSYDALAGAVVAGHVVECGTHATGGNFSGFWDLTAAGLLREPLGFPLAEISADGSCVITKHAGTGGAVTLDTVSAQLFYEIQGPEYLGPDVTTHLDSLSLSQEGDDRVRITGVRGSAPPDTLKVCVNELGGWRNSLEFLLTGRRVDAKTEWLQDQLAAAWGTNRPATVAWTESPPAPADASSQELATTRLRVTCLDPDAKVAGKGFTAPAVELALGSYPGFTLTAPPAPATPYGVYRPAYVPRSEVTETVHHPDGHTTKVPPAVARTAPEPDPAAWSSAIAEGETDPSVVVVDGSGPPAATKERKGRLAGTEGSVSPHATTATPTELGTFVHARSGDKGGDANLGLWVAHDGSENYAARVAWLLETIDADFVRRLVPEAETLEVDVHPLGNLGGVNVVLHGLLGQGVAASTRIDPQAKALGEWVLSRHVEIPEDLL